MQSKGNRNRKWIACAAGLFLMAAAGLAGCGTSPSAEQKSEAAPATAASGTNGKIIIGTQGMLAKWTQPSDKQEDGGLEGFDIDVWKEIAKRNHMEIQWRVAEFSALWGMMDNGEIQTIANDTTTNPQRLEKYDFTEPYAYDGYVFLTKKGMGANSLDWFKSRKVCVVAGANPGFTLENIDKEKNLNLNIGYLDNAGALLPAVSNGTYDAAFTIKSNAYIGIHELGMPMETFDPKYKTLPICYAFTKTAKNQVLIQKINQTLQEMRADGTLKGLSVKWLGGDITSRPE